MAARDFLRSKLTDLEWFRVQTEKDEKGKYGRYPVRTRPARQHLHQ